ncbi:hypothetical protein [Cryobacterium sp. Hh7]|nr:hypothetical protein [Cryobacterium sp. Hh7]
MSVDLANPARTNLSLEIRGLRLTLAITKDERGAATLALNISTT